jgi:IPT/TIG domain/FG-GAP-like repeat
MSRLTRTAWLLAATAGCLAAQGCGISAVGGTFAALAFTGGSSSSSSGGAPAPQVNSVSPLEGSHGGGMLVILTGEHFTEEATVSVGDTVASQVTFLDSRRLEVMVPRSSSVGPADVTVSTPGGGAAMLSQAFTYTNLLPTVAVSPLPSPQSQNVVFEVTLSDPESDPLDLQLEVSAQGFSLTGIPAADILSGSASGLSSSPTGVSHRITWDTRGLFGTMNVSQVELKITPIDTSDGLSGPAATSNQFSVDNNAPVAVDLLQPGADAFDVAVTYRVTDTDPSDPVMVTGLTWRDARTGATGAMTVKTGQNLGAVSTNGSQVTTVWDSLKDLGLGNNRLVEVAVTVSDGTNSATATSSPFFISNGPLTDQAIVDVGFQMNAFTIGDVLSDQRRLMLTGVAGTFSAGETVTAAPSGATARVSEVGSDFLIVDSEVGFFELATPDTLTGGSSGATGTLVGQEGFPNHPELIAAGESSRDLALTRNLGFALDRSFLERVPDLPGPSGAGPSQFAETRPRPNQCQAIDINGDGLRDLVLANDRYGTFAGSELLENTTSVLTQAAADAPAFADVISHQVTLRALQHAGTLDVPGGVYETSQARIDDRAPHVPLGGSVYPQAPSGNESLDNVGWFAQDLVAAELDPPGSPGYGREDLIILHGVRQLGAALGGDVRGAITLRTGNPASGPAPLALRTTPAYLDPTDMGALPTHCAVADVTSATHAAGFPGIGVPVPADYPDIVVCNTGDSSLTFYVQLYPANVPGNPFTGGTTEPLPTFTSLNIPFAPLGLPAGDLRGIAAGDLNGDGAQDLVVVGQLSKLALVLIQDPGTMDPGSLTVQTSGIVPMRLAALIQLPEIRAGRPAVADVTGDGRADLLIPSSLTNELLVYANLGNDAPGALDTTPTPRFEAVRFTTEFQPSEVTLADLNGDRALDATVMCLLSLDFSILYQVVPGTLDRFIPVPTGEAPLTLDAGDVTGDGIPEVVVALNAENRLQVFSRDSLRLLRTEANFSLSGFDAAGAPLIPPQSPTDIVAPSLPFTVRVTDVDGDGARDDIAVAMEIVLPSGVAGLEWIRGGPLESQVAAIMTGTLPAIGFSIDAGDVLGSDGIPDLVLSSQANGTNVFRGLGGGAFDSTPLVLPSIGSLDLRVVDLDGDGEQDIVVATGDVRIYYGAGGALSAPIDINVADSVLMNVADLGGPTHPVTGAPMLDVVITGFTSARASVLYQVAPRMFQEVSLTVGGEPSQPAVGDFDGDGLLDVAIPWGKDDLVGVYRRDPTATSLERNLLPPSLLPTSKTPAGAVAVDVNGDGLDDLVVSARGSNALNVFLQR